eukprot:gnl/TRDRNA2_/TRDRNA2_171629_c1_seq1.p1 gnl/TRDRNA2_/TRDRNA2_171629_c1~~gnl/TRDRNA2_/TRDRNA2_171629_c1_seq1.p1  ORF type:complete len:154 (+),score=24.53 gnl/TRDRNA2_/TRDRNA2_171629_c1_seq1:218-679(+)
MYSMGLPLLVPDNVWMMRLLRDMYVKWGQLHAEWGDRLQLLSSVISVSEVGDAADNSSTVIASAAAGWPHPPFYDPTRDPEARLEYWFPLADHLRYPHVARFSSLPAFLDEVANTRWAEVSVAMRAHFSKVLANVDRFYKHSVEALLLADKGA